MFTGPQPDLSLVIVCVVVSVCVCVFVCTIAVTDGTASVNSTAPVQLMMNEMMSAMHPLSLTAGHWCLTKCVYVYGREKIKETNIKAALKVNLILTMTNVKVPRHVLIKLISLI